MDETNNHQVSLKKNLLIDCSYIQGTWEPSSSLIIYAVRVIQGFLKYGHCQIHVLIWRELEDLFDKLIGQEYDKILLDHDDLVTSWRPYYRVFGFLPRHLKKEMKKRGITTVLQPSHLYGILYYSPPVRQFVIIHDLFEYDIIREERGKISYCVWRRYHRYLIRKYPNVITISQATHDELMREDGKESDIAHNSIPFDFLIPEQPVDIVQGKKYILDINRFTHYKNAETLIRAFGLIKDEIPHILYLKGDRNYVKERLCLENLASQLGLQDRIIFDTQYRTEGELRFLYTHTDLFVSPSLKEGFGWTPIEASILKTPTLVSDLDAFKEVTCGKVPTFDPRSPEDLATHIIDILNNPPSNQERTNLSYFFMEKYSLKNQIDRLENILYQRKAINKI